MESSAVADIKRRIRLTDERLLSYRKGREHCSAAVTKAMIRFLEAIRRKLEEELRFYRSAGTT